MPAIDYLKQHELNAELKDDNRLRVWPKENITPSVRDWIKQHKEPLLTELNVVNVQPMMPKGIRLAWTIRVGDKRMTMAGIPYTRDQALRAAQARWPKHDVEIIESTNA
ncbi:hypothetical protein [Vreelandella alkaliphila]|uniref:Uncharacterized protein n=1 Tax=Vreelandella alkaliphila TaxID=272774 RepID=A0A7C9K4H5_9GAMM|nr:hypothetical protein [Halomonas alkaliphila]NDL69341.1 hypothetical protein [Halomonas alkaliphila]